MLRDEAVSSWLSAQGVGIALLLEPTPEFYSTRDDKDQKLSFGFLFKYLLPYKQEISQTVLALFVTMIIQLIFPFLSQSVIDFGINNHNLNFVQLILIAQLSLTVISIATGYIQSWISLHVGTQLSISMLSDFLIKLLSLPISFFNTRSIGDILQRMNDNGRVLSFITSSPLTVLFSIINLIVYGFIMLFYSIEILSVFLAGNLLYTGWILLFLKKRRELDFEGFSKSSEARNNQIQLITHIQDIKLNNVEKEKRWEWEDIQAGIFRWRIKGLKLEQTQGLGAQLINQTKNISMSYLSASLVISGEMTLGMMVAIQYMIGQLQQPFSAFTGLIRSVQDVKISLERLGEVTGKKGEEDPDTTFTDYIPEEADIHVNNLTFSYYGKSSGSVLNEINMRIPFRRTTAVVGVSGSGKTTLLKLLLKLYDSEEGTIKIGTTDLKNVRHSDWRNICGSVMQDGEIFEDTLLKNIAVGDSYPDIEKINKSIAIANLNDFIEQLPLGFNTKIGNEFLPLSQGQKQRVLMARMLYQDPPYIFLDEATASLDTKNEYVIMKKLAAYARNKTVFVIAHRLSTIVNADQIIVLDKGKIAETGVHDDLIKRKGHYFNLVKNQLNI